LKITLSEEYLKTIIVNTFFHIIRVGNRKRSLIVVNHFRGFSKSKCIIKSHIPINIKYIDMYTVWKKNNNNQTNGSTFENGPLPKGFKWFKLNFVTVCGVIFINIKPLNNHTYMTIYIYRHNYLVPYPIIPHRGCCRYIRGGLYSPPLAAASYMEIINPHTHPL